jgi:hypothetical protein
MLDHGMVAEAELAGHAHALRPGLDAFELHALWQIHQLGAVESGEKIQMPPGAAEFAIGNGLQACLFLFLDNLLDLAIFDLLQIAGGDLGPLSPPARFPDCRGTQQAADMIGAKRRIGAVHERSPVGACCTAVSAGLGVKLCLLHEP